MIAPLLLALSMLPDALGPLSQTSAPVIESTPVWQELTPPADLSGWKVCCGPAQYDVSNGVVTGTTVAGSPNTFLITEKKYGDFELEYEFKVDSKLNAGVQIRSEVVDNRMRGCQIEIDMDEDRQRFWSAGIYEEGDRGWLCDLSKNPEAIAAHNIDDWNHVRVVTRGAMIETFLNGVPAAKTWCGQRLKGVIGLQVHGVGASQTEPLKVQWRHLKIRDHGEHHWVTWADSAKESPISNDKAAATMLWKVTPTSAMESLKLELKLDGQQALSLNQGDLSYRFSSPKCSFNFRFPPLDGKTEDGGPMGGRGSSFDHSWMGSRIFLHRNPWGVGYEILGGDGSWNSRKIARFKNPQSESRRELEITATGGATWKLQALIPKSAPK